MKDAPICAGGYSADDPKEFHCADCEASKPEECMQKLTRNPAIDADMKGGK